MRSISTAWLISGLLVLLWMGICSPGVSEKAARGDPRIDFDQAPAGRGTLSTLEAGAKEKGSTARAEGPYGLHYNEEENSWILHARVLRVKRTSIYGHPGEIAQIEYSLDGERMRKGWIVLRIDGYSFVDQPGEDVAIRTGQELELTISGRHVSRQGVNWEKCPREDTYCLNAAFVEGGFPKSEDYDGLTLCPSNTLLRSGFFPDDWINGMLAWKVRDSVSVPHG